MMRLIGSTCKPSNGLSGGVLIGRAHYESTEMCSIKSATNHVAIVELDMCQYLFAIRQKQYNSLEYSVLVI